MKRTPRLRTILSLSFVLAAVVPLLVIGSLTLVLLTRHLTHEISTKNQALARTLTGEIEQFLDEPLALLAQAGELLDRGQIPSSAGIDAYLDSILHHFPYFISLQVLNEAGVITHLSPFDRDYLNLNMSGQPFYRSTLESGVPQWSQTFVSTQTSQPTVTLSLPLARGMLVGYLNLEVWSRTMALVSQTTSGTVVLLDRTGTVIAHPERRLVAQRINLRNLSSVRRGLAGEANTMADIYDGEPVLASVSLVPETGWLVLFIQSEKSAFGPLRYSIGLLVMGLLLTAALAVSLAYLSLRKTLKPLSHLVHMADRAAGGDYQIEDLPESYSEIDELSEDLKHMISAVREREAAIEENRRLLQGILDFAPAVIFIKDAQGHYRLVNRWWEVVTRIAAKDAIGRTDWELFPAEVATQFSSVDRQVLEQREPMENEVLIPDDGDWQTFLVVKFTLQNPSDGSNVLCGIATDITQRKKTEEALKASERRYKVLFEGASDGIYVYDFEGRLLDVNRVCCDYLGYDRAAFLRLNLRQIIAPEVAVQLPERMDRIRREKKVVRESTLVRRDGSNFPVETHSRLVDYNGGPAVLAVIRDISVRKRAEAEKSRLQAQLHQTAKLEAIGTLAGGIAHDFNNILAAIIGYTEITLADLPSDTIVRRNLQAVLQAGQRARDLVQQILTFSRQAEVEKKPVKVRPLVNEALKLMRASLPASIEIRQRLDCEALIEGDPTQIHQVVMNLCTNAGQALPGRTGVIEIELKEARVDLRKAAALDLPIGEYVRLRVSDSGQGIPDEIQTRIFEPFFTTKEKGVGTGMGLSVVHGIVDNHGGAVRVTSHVGEGTVFEVYFPTINTFTVDRNAPPSMLVKGSARILLVDDEPSLIDLGRQMLGRLGYQVTTVNDSREALALVQKAPQDFDLVITDLTMPKMTGDVLAREFKALRPDLPVILCTGFSQAFDGLQADASGIDGVIHKPYQFETLAATVDTALHGRANKRTV